MFYDTRTLCGVLEDMRKCYETRNFSYLLGLIEEAQTMGNRMEGALEDQDYYKHLRKRIKRLTKLRDKLKDEIKDKGGDTTSTLHELDL